MALIALKSVAMPDNLIQQIFFIRLCAFLKRPLDLPDFRGREEIKSTILYHLCHRASKIEIFSENTEEGEREKEKRKLSRKNREKFTIFIKKY